MAVSLYGGEIRGRSLCSRVSVFSCSSGASHYRYGIFRGKRKRKKRGKKLSCFREAGAALASVLLCGYGWKLSPCHVLHNDIRLDARIFRKDDQRGI